MSSLLEEAIIDAKALKEAALKSAQEAILEKYTPEVKKAIENMLLEQTDQPLVDPDLDALSGQNAPGATLNNQTTLAAVGGTNLCPCPDDNQVVVVDFPELQKSMMKAPEMQVDQSTLPPPMTPVEGPAMAPDVSANVAPEVPKGLEDEEEQPLDEEIELSEEFINSLLEDEELFEELEELEETSLGKKSVEAGYDDNPEITRADIIIAAKNKKNKKSVEEDLRYQPPENAVEAVKDSPRKQKATIVLRQMEKMAKKELAEDVQSLNEVRQLNNTNSRLLEENKKIQENNKLLVEENARLTKQHEELQETALELSKRLQQLNVQNAKLYYKNQALSSVSLNERQKEKIVEAISKADSVDEVKIIYETLQSAVGSSKVIKEPKSLSEAVTRNSGFSIRSREKEEPASNGAFDRWQKIAGIKK